MLSLKRCALSAFCLFLISCFFSSPLFADELPIDSSSTAQIIEPAISPATTPPIDPASPDSTNTADLLEYVHPIDAVDLQENIPSSSQDFIDASSTTVIATSTEPLSITSSSTTSSTATVVSSTLGIVFHPLLDLIAPAPITGPEWVQFRGVTTSSASLLLGWHLEDSSSAILTFTSSTHLIIDPITSLIRVELKSARLNNGGDRVALIKPDGEIVDETTYPSMQRDQRWARDGDIWKKVPEPIIVLIQAPNPIPLAQTDPPPIETASSTIEQILPAESTTSSTILSPPSVETETITSSTESITPIFVEEEAIEPSTPIIIEQKIASPDPPKPARRANTKPKKSSTKGNLPERAKDVSSSSLKKSPHIKNDLPLSPKKKSSVQRVSSIKKRASSKKQSASSPLLFVDDFSMLSSLSSYRVRLTGTVGTAPRMVSKNQFVLLNPDGRGLLVQKLSTQSTPPYKTMISVTGNLVVNDDGLSLHMTKKDTWKQETTSTEDLIPEPRPVNLTAPAQEDAWSYLQVEGIVKDIHPTRVTIDLESGILLEVSLKQTLGYRVSRLHKGDTIRVQGILDLRTEHPLLLPQKPDDIEILSEAPAAAATKASDPGPIPWLPFGAAGTSVALTHSYHWLKNRKKEGFLDHESDKIRINPLE